MAAVIDKSLEDYVAAGDETTRELLEENGPLVQALKVYYDYFATAIWADPKTELRLPQKVGTLMTFHDP